MVEPAWLGRRIVIRHALDRDESGRLRFSDTVGDLVALTDETATVETRHGRADVPVAHVAVAKVVEPAAAEILALEGIAARGWRARESVESHGWLLRADAGYTSRANSVLPRAQLSVPLDAALDEAQGWYAERGLPLRIQLPLHARRLLDAELGERGWPATPDTDVLATRIDLRPVEAPEVRITDSPDDAWVARFRDGAMPPAARSLLTRHDRVGFAQIRRDGTTVAIARGAVDEGWLGVTAVEVEPAARRQGLAAAVTHALWRWAVTEHGATRSYVQVLGDNDAALRLYERLGYWQHHVYRYRTQPS